MAVAAFLFLFLCAVRLVARRPQPVVHAGGIKAAARAKRGNKKPPAKHRRRGDGKQLPLRNAAPHPHRAARIGHTRAISAEDVQAMRHFEEYEIEPELSGCNEFKFSRAGEQVEAFEVDDEICPDDSVSMAMWRAPPPPLPPPPRVPPVKPRPVAAPRRLAAAAEAARSGDPDPQPLRPRAPPRLQMPPAPEPRAPPPPRAAPRAPPPPRLGSGRPTQSSDEEMTLMALSTPASAYAKPSAARQPLKLAGAR